MPTVQLQASTVAMVMVAEMGPTEVDSAAVPMTGGQRGKENGAGQDADPQRTMIRKLGIGANETEEVAVPREEVMLTLIFQAMAVT
jgi:hypothetical protein